MEKCCYRWSLRFGSLLWAWFSLLIGILGVTACAVTLSKWDVHREDIFARFPKSPKVPDFTLGVIITFFLFQAGRAFFASMLLIGLYKEMERFILSFLIFTIFSALHLFINLLVTVDIAVTFPVVVAADLIGSVIFIFAEIYCGLVVRSYYKELKRKKRKERIDATFEEVDDDDDDDDE